MSNGERPTPPQSAPLPVTENPWARLGLPATFQPMADCSFTMNKILGSDGKTVRYVVVFLNPFGATGCGFDEGGFAEFVRQCQAMRTGLVLPGT